MKKMKIATIGLLALVFGMILTGCEDATTTTTPAPTVHERAESVFYKVTLGTDMLTCFGVQVKYKNAAGTTTTETIQTNSWETTINNVTLPFVADVNLVYTKKDGATLSTNAQGGVTVNRGRLLQLSYRYEASSSWASGINNDTRLPISLEATRLGEWQTRYAGRTFSDSCTIPK
jgi:hypothetical protein